MMVMMSIAVFAAALTASVYALLLSVGPNMARIGAALVGRPEPRFAPLRSLSQAERRIAVRRWAASSPPTTAWREAA